MNGGVILFLRIFYFQNTDTTLSRLRHQTLRNEKLQADLPPLSIEHSPGCGTGRLELSWQLQLWRHTAADRQEGATVSGAEIVLWL